DPAAVAHQPHAGTRSQGESPALSDRGGDTIAAVATPAGRGGIGVVRVSGPASRAIAQAIVDALPEPRQALYASFRAAGGELIDASSAEAVRSAARSLAGEFSHRVHALVEALTELRAHVEACIDFPEEEIDPADREGQAAKLAALREALAALIDEARQGAVLR